MRHPGRVTLIGSIGWHAAILVMSQIEWFSVSVPVLMLTGIAQAFSMVTMSMMLLSASSPEIRGRIMGIRSLAVYGLPLGLVASGAAADAFGVSLALVINGVVGIVFTVLIAVWLRKLWSPPRS
jgi:MFS family permease